MLKLLKHDIKFLVLQTCIFCISQKYDETSNKAASILIIYLFHITAWPKNLDSLFEKI